MRHNIGEFVKQKSLKPPLSLHQLETLADEFLSPDDAQYREWTMVELHNHVWMDTVRAIPPERRLLLLPKCLSSADECEGEIDEYGLLCHQCGRCIIPDLQAQAEAAGIMSIVAEGFTTVIELIRHGVVDAVIGVSCLDSLEKAFPLLTGHAIPGIAIPLNDGGCRNTHVDAHYVSQLLPLTADNTLQLLRTDDLRKAVNQWFSRDMLARLLSPASDDTSRAAHEWLAADGKRWRPFLLTAVYTALTGKTTEEAIQNPDLWRCAVAIECFHKASLIHDDIQDGDLTRYGRPTVNAIYGDAVAINIGDFLLGEGYRLLAMMTDKQALAIVAEAHINLCRGQGAELMWNATGTAPTTEFVLNVFRQKTVPAFEVALILGLLCAGGDEPTANILKQYSEVLGLAYQLLDDCDDMKADTLQANRPSAVAALKAQHPEWSNEEQKNAVRKMADEYHDRALFVLADIDNLELKRLLFQVTEKILNHTKT